MSERTQAIIDMFSLTTIEAEQYLNQYKIDHVDDHDSIEVLEAILELKKQA